jgi:hypothetical protein
LCAYAPKQLLVSEGGVTKDLEKIIDAYATAGDPGAFEYVYHRFYRDPANRKYDGVEVQPDCISLDEYYVWCNVDVNDHYFKKDIAIPWTNKLCGKE